VIPGVPHFVILLLVIGGAGVYLMTSQERSRVALTAMGILHDLRRLTTLDDLQPRSFVDAIETRTRWAVCTPLICLANATIFALMVLRGAGGSPESLVDWGANFWPRTVNGEWWRMVSSLFVHSGFLHMAANVLGLLQVGLILERIVGPVTFGAAYLTAGASAGLISIFVAPGSVTNGGSAATLGIYGLFLATSAWNLLQRSDLVIPLDVVKRVAPGVFAFLIYIAATQGLWHTPNIVAFSIGLVGGLITLRNVSTEKPPLRRVAGVMGAALAICAIGALIMREPVRETANVRAELDHVIAIEAHTARVYDKTVERFRAGRVTVEALTDLIERTILPELRSAQVRLKTLDGVQGDDKPLIATAQNYLNLRDESWRMRARALKASDMAKLREADRKEQASLAALQTLMPKRNSAGSQKSQMSSF